MAVFFCKQHIFTLLLIQGYSVSATACSVWVRKKNCSHALLLIWLDLLLWLWEHSPWAWGLEGHPGSASSSSRSFEAHFLVHVPFPGLSFLKAGVGGVPAVLRDSTDLWGSPVAQTHASSHLALGQLSQNPSGWEGSLRSLRAALDWSPPCHADRGTECHIQPFLEHLQECCPYIARKVRFSFSKNIFLVARQKLAQEPFLSLPFWLLRDFLDHLWQCVLWQDTSSCCCWRLLLQLNAKNFLVIPDQIYTQHI